MVFISWACGYHVPVCSAPHVPPGALRTRADEKSPSTLHTVAPGDFALIAPPETFAHPTADVHQIHHLLANAISAGSFWGRILCCPGGSGVNQSTVDASQQQRSNVSTWLMTWADVVGETTEAT